MHYNFTAKLFTNYFSLILYHKSFSWYLVRLHFFLPYFHQNIKLNKKNILLYEYFICVHTFLFPHSQLTLQSKTTFKTCIIKLFMFQLFFERVLRCLEIRVYIIVKHLFYMTWSNNTFLSTTWNTNVPTFLRIFLFNIINGLEDIVIIRFVSVCCM